ncbi:hypothetical protein J1614_010348 [Plenodomus biglobosus]|nr:hypothetical protein J1614_010348 [Plenodomus biglobosus]
MDRKFVIILFHDRNNSIEQNAYKSQPMHEILIRGKAISDTRTPGREETSVDISELPVMATVWLHHYHHRHRMNLQFTNGRRSRYTDEDTGTGMASFDLGVMVTHTPRYSTRLFSASLRGRRNGIKSRVVPPLIMGTPDLTVGSP